MQERRPEIPRLDGYVSPDLFYSSSPEPETEEERNRKKKLRTKKKAIAKAKAKEEAAAKEAKENENKENKEIVEENKASSNESNEVKKESKDTPDVVIKQEEGVTVLEDSKSKDAEKEKDKTKEVVEDSDDEECISPWLTWSRMTVTKMPMNSQGLPRSSADQQVQRTAL